MENKDVMVFLLDKYPIRLWSEVCALLQRDINITNTLHLFWQENLYITDAAFQTRKLCRFLQHYSLIFPSTASNF